MHNWNKNVLSNGGGNSKYNNIMTREACKSKSLSLVLYASYSVRKISATFVWILELGFKIYIDSCDGLMKDI